MTAPLALAVLAAPAAFGVVAAWALAPTTDPRRRLRRVARAGTIAAWSGAATALLAGTWVATRGAVSSPTIGTDGLGISTRLDPLSVSMLIMITLLAVVIFRFSCTYLDGDVRHRVFLGRLAATIAAVEVLVTAGNLVVLVGAWVATSLALHKLLLFHRDRPRAVTAARKKFVAARAGDAFLIAGALLLVQRFGTGDLEQIFTDVGAAAPAGWGPGAAEAAAVCLVIAAMLKSAQFPTHGWLVEVMETPTPVSALLHAGILNAGPFLAIRMAYVIEGAPTATALLIAVGGFTAVFASIVLLTQPSVKVALGYSSAAHMGFMLMVCGMGFYPAALLHLVAHSFYKAHAFLSSGSAVDEKRPAKVPLPSRLGSPARIAGSAAIALGLYLPLAWLWGVDLGADPLALAVGGILVIGTTQLVAPALDSTGPVMGSIRAAGLALAVTLSFFVLEAGAHHLLADTIPDRAGRGLVHGALAAGILVAFAVVVGLQILEPSRPPSARRRALAVHLRNGLYANALFDRAVGALRSSSPQPETIR